MNGLRKAKPIPPMPSKLYPFEPFSFFMGKVLNAWLELQADPNYQFKAGLPVIDYLDEKNKDIVLYSFSSCFVIYNMDITWLKLRSTIGIDRDWKKIGKLLDDSYGFQSIEILGDIFHRRWVRGIYKYYKLIHRQHKRKFKMKGFDEMSKTIMVKEAQMMPQMDKIIDHPAFISARLSVLSDLVYQYENEYFGTYFDWAVPCPAGSSSDLLIHNIPVSSSIE